MDPRTGEIYPIENSEQLKELNKRLRTQLVELTEAQAKVMAPLSKRMRKKLLAGMSCPCASGKSFKKCCSRKKEIPDEREA
jgi:uncharacterized protein YecA (UPF0149 family)